MPVLVQDTVIDHCLSNTSPQVRGKVRMEEAELRKSHPNGTFLMNPKKNFSDGNPWDAKKILGGETTARIMTEGDLTYSPPLCNFCASTYADPVNI